MFASFNNGVGADDEGRILANDRPIPAGFAPTMTVTPPDGGAIYGQEVTVQWTGMPPGPAFLQECPVPAVVASRGESTYSTCDSRTNIDAFTGADGRGTAKFVLFPRLNFMTPGGQVTQPCTIAGTCEIRVSSCSLDYGDNVAAHAPAPAAVAGDLVQDDGDLIPATPKTYLPPAPKPLNVISIPQPKATNRATIFGAGGTGPGLAFEALSGQSLAVANGVDVSYAARTIVNGYEALIEDKNDFAVAALPLIPESFFPTPAGADAEDSAALAKRRELAALTNANLVYVPIVAGSLDAAYDINVNGLQQNELRISQDALALMTFTKSGLDLGTGQLTRNYFTKFAFSGWDQQQRCRVPERTIASQGNAAQSLWLNYAGRSEPSSTNWKLSEFVRATRPTLTDRPANDPDFYQSATAQGDKAERTGSNALALSLSDLGLNLSPLADPLSVQLNKGSGRVGFIDHAYSLRYSNRVAAVQNPAGAYVLPSQAGVTATLKQATIDRAAGLVNVGFGGSDPSAYPLAMLYYAAVPKTLTASLTAENAKDLKEFLTYAVSPAGQAKVGSIGYTPLTPELAAFATEQIAKIGQPAAETPTTTVPDAPADADSTPDSTVLVPSGGTGSGGYSGSSGSSVYSGGAGTSSVDGLESSAPELSADSATPADPNVTVSGEDSGPLAAIARVAGDLLGMPGISPGLVLLGIIGSIACIAGPVMGRISGRRRAS